MSLSLFLQHHPTCLVWFIWMVLEIGGRWPYNCCLVGCCFQNLFSIACGILVLFLSSFFSICFINVQVVHSYGRIDTTAAWKKSCFILSDRSDFHMINNQLITVHTFVRCILMPFSYNFKYLIDTNNLYPIDTVSSNYSSLIIFMLYSFKYSYQISIICTQLYGVKYLKQLYCLNWSIFREGNIFTNGPGEWGLIPG